MLQHDFLMEYCVVVDVAFDQLHKKVVRGRPRRLRFALWQISLFGSRHSKQAVKHLMQECLHNQAIRTCRIRNAWRTLAASFFSQNAQQFSWMRCSGQVITSPTVLGCVPLSWLTELRFYIPLDTKQVISDMILKPISWLNWYGKN